MHKEIISDKQGISLVVLFITGDSLIMATASQAKNDFWIAIIFSIVFAVLMQLVFVRIHVAFPEKDLFNINECLFGNFFGKLLNLFFIFYVAVNGISILRLFSEFITTLSLPETPKVAPILLIIFICIWVVKEGIETLGRVGEFLILGNVILILIAVSLLVKEMEIDNILPVLYNGIKPVFEGTYATLIFPFTETVAFTMIFSSFRNKKSPYKIYITGLLIGGFIVLVTTLTEVLVLGVDFISITYFPSYSTVSHINVGDLIQRIEIMPAITFMIGGLVKISVLLLAVSKGITKLFIFNKYKFLVTPIALLMLNISLFFYENIMHVFKWGGEIWMYFAFPFQIVLPIIIIIAIVIKKKRLMLN